MRRTAGRYGVKLFIILVCSLCLFPDSAWAQVPGDPPDIAIERYVGEFTSPTIHTIHAGDSSDRLFVAEQAGLIRSESPGVMPLPAGGNTFSYPAVILPTISVDPALAKPVSTGFDTTGDPSLNLRIALPQFDANADIYFGVYAPNIDASRLYLLSTDNSLSPQSSSIFPWKKKSTGPIDELPFGTIPIHTLQPGPYYLYLFVTPADDLSRYYLWNTSFGVNSNDGTVVQTSALARDMSPQVSDADLAAVVSGNTEFALNVFPLLDPAPENNTFFSPYSITHAFALLAPGARGTSLSGIEQALSISIPLDRYNPALNNLDLLLSGKTTGAILNGGLQAPILNNADAVWAQQGFYILSDYLDALAVNFGAGVHIIDFINSTEESRQTINTWVEGKTNNRIQDLIPPNGVKALTRLVLTNAIWFKANWASRFSKNSTKNQSFSNHGGTISSIPFMRQMFVETRLPYAQTDGCQAVDIPYAGDDLSMLVIMPDSGTFDAFLSSLTPTVVSDITNHLTLKKVDLSIPKFDITKAPSMRTILISLGMSDLFSPFASDLSGIDGNRDLLVGDVFHKAFIAIDEDGTEAAAATAIGILAGGPPPSPDLTLAINHPFIFLIRDRQTGLILFMGKVVSL